MLYTRNGDNGTTSIFGCNQLFTKSSVIAEALGTVDELNSFLGLCKVHSEKIDLSIEGKKVYSIIEEVQQNLFIIQAEFAGADKHIADEKIIEMEKIISDIEKELPEIKSFFVSGGTELATLFDIARTIARRAERCIVALYMEKDGAMPYGQDIAQKSIDIHEPALVYANRLSSLLYALARFANHNAGISESSPTYK